MPASAVILALLTVALWSFLAFLGARVSHLPPFLVVGAALTISGLVGAVRARDWRVPPLTLAVGIGGLFGYHFLYFSAFHYAPAVEANMLNYLWPLLIVMLSPVYLQDAPLKLHHILGAAAGFAGAALIVTGGRLQPDLQHLPGYLLAAGAAFVWASYSLLTKRVPPFPTGAVGAFCLLSGLLSLGLYALQQAAAGQPVVFPAGKDWISLVLLGAGPMGLAFFTWDAALKRGDPRIIGSLTYLTPLLSTIILVVIGGQALSPVSAVAMVLIVSGAVLGSVTLLRPRRLAGEKLETREGFK